MRRLLVVVIALCLAGTALAVQGPTSNKLDPKGYGDGMSNPRTGGDTIADATVIPSLPYTDTGATCGYIQDYVDCVYNAGAPDVVYAYTPAADGAMNVSLCGSGYDTGLWVYAGGVGNTVGCNDDFCGLQSEIDSIPVTAGVTYYIVISGYSTACGSYILNVLDVPPPQPCDPIPCPTGGVPEGEPACYDNYIDSTNGGCNSTGWTVVPGDETICGLSGTYLYSGASYRDTDWFDATGGGGVVTLTCTASFDLQLLFIYAASGVISCSNYSYDIATAPCEVPAVLSRTIAAGAHFWPWVGPSVFTGVDCNSTYTLEIVGTGTQPPMGACCVGSTCTITTEANCSGTWQGADTVCNPNPCPTPTEPTSWGSIKNIYK